MAQAAAGNPNRFITLTINPSVGSNPEHRLRLLARAWRLIVKRLRRQHPQTDIAYLAVVEGTKRGEPHLHILYRGPYIAQRWLSEAMDGIAESPIVDIRRVRDPNQVVRYVAKYITKRPAQFGTSKRYWRTQNYEPPEEPDPENPLTPRGSVTVARESLPRLVGAYHLHVLLLGLSRDGWWDVTDIPWPS